MRLELCDMTTALARLATRLAVCALSLATLAAAATPASAAFRPQDAVAPPAPAPLAPVAPFAQDVLWSAEGLAPDDGFGRIVRRASHDMDGDGLPELLVGAPRHSAEHPGTVQVLSARTGRVLLELRSELPDDGFGTALDTAGDVDGDGSIDILVGVPLDTEGALSGGSVRLYSGSDGEEILRVVGETPYGNMGRAVTGLDDVDGDGYPDLVVSEPGDELRGQEAGGVFCLSGSEDGGLLWYSPGGTAEEGFGLCMARLPDLDGDGVDDLAVGAPGASNEGLRSGRVALLSGADGRLILHAFGPAAGRFGSSLDHAGDIDGDGFADVVVGDPSALVAGTPHGKAWVMSGKDGSLLLDIDGPLERVRFGFSVAGAGDVDGDGTNDLLVGAHDSNQGGHAAGMAGVYSGKSGAPMMTVLGERPSMMLGYAVSGLGDIDEDGHADVVVSALQQGGPRATTGVVRVLKGRAAPIVSTETSPLEER